MLFRLLLTLVVCASFCATPLQAQKAKFKNFKATCQKARLPQVYVEPDKRTYALYVKGSYSADVEPYNRGVYGWTADEESPNVEAVVSMYGFQVNPAKRTSEKKQTKNKEGEVTASWTEYKYSGSAVGKATLYVYGEDNVFKYKKNEDEMSKAELRKKEEEAAKKKELEANPFLSAEDVEDAGSDDKGESDIGEDSGLDGAMLPLVVTQRLDVSKSVSTSANKSISKAYEDYKNNQRPKLTALRSSYPRTAYKNAVNKLNARYGYSPVNYTVWMKQMKSDKHPDFKMWNDACQATNTLFKAFKYNKSIADAPGKFAPITGFFKSKVESIPDSDKKGKNMKKAAFDNLINTMYYLDQYDEVIELCHQYEDSKFLDKASKKMLKKVHRQKALMEFHKLESCHLENLQDSGDDEVEVESEEEEPAADEGQN